MRKNIKKIYFIYVNNTERINEITFYKTNETLAYGSSRTKCRLLSVSKQSQSCVYFLDGLFITHCH